MLQVDTPHGAAHVNLHRADEPRAALILGHGAGGGVTSRDLVAVTDAALSEGVAVALVEQPYRVAGRRSPAPAHHLDDAWLAVVEELERVRVPMLVVQGERDPFGIPPAAARRKVVRVPGDHSLRTDVQAVAEAVRTWLHGIVRR